MSWATCYSGSNNIHFDFPPLMSDGRIHSSWQPSATINENIRKNSGMQTNWEYRRYLEDNAKSIMSQNSLAYCNELGLPIHKDSHEINVPHKYRSTFDSSQPRYGYHESDLKNPYLTRQQLQAKIFSPSLAPSLLQNHHQHQQKQQQQKD